MEYRNVTDGRTDRQNCYTLTRAKNHCMPSLSTNGCEYVVSMVTLKVEQHMQPFLIDICCSFLMQVYNSPRN